jgi:glutathione synthase/RimK-type ligase-like ATP-grasp enzyme
LQTFVRDYPKRAKAFILKPASSCQGKGISIVKDIQVFSFLFLADSKKIKASEHMVVQEYITRPFLVDGFKFVR